MIFLRRIVGDSMLPTLKPGQIVLVSHFKTLRVGSVVVALQNSREVVKRIASITGDWQLQLLGDNQVASTDSRQLGTVPKRHVLGVVIWPNTNSGH